MKKLLSIILAAVMLFGTLGISTGAMAAQDTVKIPIYGGTLYGASVTAAIDKVNKERANKITADESLTKIAEQRAFELMIYAENGNDILPNGNSVSTRLSGYNTTEFTGYERVYASTAQNITDSLYDYIKSGLDDMDELNIKIKSVGIAAYKCKADDSYVSFYFIGSLNNATPASARTNRVVNMSTDCAVSNLGTVAFDVSDNSSLNAEITLKFYPKGYASGTLTIPSSEYNLVSATPSVVKAKTVSGKHLVFPKKNGNFTLNAKTKKGTVIYSFSNNLNAFYGVKPNISSIKSKKKKTVKLSWNPIITDFSGYEIQYSTDRKFKKKVKTKVVKGAKKRNATLKKLKSKKRYYVRVRAYLNQGYGEKAYTSWSKAKKVKVK